MPSLGKKYFDPEFSIEIVTKSKFFYFYFLIAYLVNVIQLKISEYL